jgi:STE24 endopeptidase
LLMLAALYFQWFAWLDSFVRDRFNNSILISLAFIAIASLVSSLASLPFGIYGTFVLEERFGFNKTTPKLFILDLIKGTALGAVIGGAILSVILWLYETLDGTFWIAAWAVVAGFSIIMFMFGTSVILPLFNKVKPLEEGALRTEIEKYCSNQGYSLRRLFVMDASKRSTKANAFFSGLGKSKTIVLFDTLIEQMDNDEIVAVLAHEIGHYKLRHSLVMFITSNIQTLAILALFGWALNYPTLSRALGADTGKFHLSAIAFFILLTPLSLLLDLLANSISRKNELSADVFSVNTYKKEPMASALKKLASNNLTNLSPHPLYVAFEYSHPPVYQRLRNILNF